MGQVLQEFLKLGLMDGVDSDDSFNRLQEGATELAGQLTSSPAELIPTVLVVLDSDASASEPIFKQAEDCILGKWKTFRSRYQDPPRALLRAVIWEALAQTTADSTPCSAITWLTGASVLPHARIGREREVVRQLLQEIALSTEKAATKHVVPDGGTDISVKLVQPKLPKVPNFGIRADSIQSYVNAALGPATGHAGENGNPIHVQVNANALGNAVHNWIAELAPRLTTAIVASVNLGLAEVSKQVDAAQSKLADSTLALTKSLAEGVKSALTSNQVHSDLRLSVLWWAEALYSPSIKDSYRVLPPTAAVVAMAHDLFNQVGSMTPASVAYTLGETVTRLPSVSWTQKYTLSSLLGGLHQERERLGDLIAKPQQHEGRRPLLETVEAVVHGAPLSAGEISIRTGLSEDLQITLPEFAMWCFRNLQARDLSEQESE